MRFGRRAERRWFQRVPVAMGAELLTKNNVEWRRAEILDPSWRGVRIGGERLALKRGDSVHLVITQASNRDQRRARVVWVESSGGHASQAGLEFV